VEVHVSRWLPSKHKVLSSNPDTVKKKKKRKEIRNKKSRKKERRKERKKEERVSYKPGTAAWVTQ
jgi:hypothetical protein